MIITVDSSGNIIEIEKVSNTIENNDYQNRLLYSSKRTVNNIEYSIKNDFGVFNLFTTSYSKLIVKNSKGEDRLIYDVHSTQLLKIIVIFIAVVACISVAGVVVVKNFKKQEERTEV